MVPMSISRQRNSESLGREVKMEVPSVMPLRRSEGFLTGLSSCAAGCGGGGAVGSSTWSDSTVPSKIRIWRVAQCSTCSKLCVTIISSLSRETSRRSWMISSDVTESRLPVGSSARMMGLSFASARAMTVRCFCPPESRLPFWRRWSAMPTRVSSSTARRRRSRRSAMCIRASSTFCRTV